MLVLPCVASELQDVCQAEEIKKVFRRAAQSASRLTVTPHQYDKGNKAAMIKQRKQKSPETLPDRAISLIINHRRKIEKAFLALVVLSLFCLPFVKVNYDLSEYLPDWAPSKEGINVMDAEFGYPGTARVMIGPVSIYEAKHDKDLIEKIDGVDMVMWADAASDLYQSASFLDQGRLKDYYNDGYAVMDVTFVEGDSSARTHRALDEIKALLGGKGFYGGSAVQNQSLSVTLTREIAIAMAMGVIMIYIILTLTTNSWFEPILFLLIMGIAIVINMGTNIFLGTISFLTFSVAAILQLAIAMDYSIFLLHTFTREKAEGLPPESAMANAIRLSVSSILSSGATTIVGFIVLSMMRFSIGFDMGIVLSKGIVISLFTVLFLMPALILRWTDRIEKTAHKPFIPPFDRFAKALFKTRYAIAAVCAVAVVPCCVAQNMNYFLYGNDSLGSSPGTRVYEDEAEMNRRFGRSNLLLALVPNDSMVSEKQLTEALKDLAYVKSATSLAGTLPEGVPEGFLPKSLTSQLHTERYSRILITIKTASESELAFRCSDEIAALMKSYYPENSYLVGVTPSTQDIKEIISDDYDDVNILSLIGVAAVVAITFKSGIIPIVVMVPIQIAIFINMALPYFYGSRVIFMGYIIVSCLQLGATIDYSILVTNNYLNNRLTLEKRESAVASVSQSALSVMTSGFILTIVGYGLYFTSSVAAIADLGRLVGRGAFLSMLLVLGLLPVLLVIFDQAIFDQQKRLRRLERIHALHRRRRRRREQELLAAAKQKRAGLERRIAEFIAGGNQTTAPPPGSRAASIKSAPTAEDSGEKDPAPNPARDPEAVPAPNERVREEAPETVPAAALKKECSHEI